MIKDLINDRMTVHTWLDTPIEQDKIDYIIECAINAPSKQSIYPYTLNVLTNSPEATEFKEWLYWNDTWIVDGVRVDPENTNSTRKRFNGQYRAPLLLMWSFRLPPEENHNDMPYWKAFSGQLSRGTKYQVIADIAISSSFALLAAEEQGLRTGFANCHSYTYNNTILGEGEVEVMLALGIGYAEFENNPDNPELLASFANTIKPVYRDGVLEGTEHKNLPVTYPKEHHIFRSRKPNNENLINII